MDVRDNWRVIVLTVVVLASVFTVLAPTAEGDGGAPGVVSEGPTNLNYGIELSGGTRIRAPLVGVTAEGVAFGGDDPATVERQVAAELADVAARQVTARRQDTSSGTVEVTVDGVTTGDLANALSAAGYEFDRSAVRAGVTEETRQQTVDILADKINQAGLSGGSVQVLTTPTGEKFVSVSVPNADRQQVIDLVTSRGTVVVQAYYPTQENGTSTYQRETILTRDTFQSIGTAQQGQGDRLPYVPVTVTDGEAERVRSEMGEAGLTQPGGTRCTYETTPNSTDPCLLVVVDGEVVNSFGMSADLARSMRTGEWTRDPSFILQTRNFTEARDVAINLRAGALPAPLDLGDDAEWTVSFIGPSQGQSYKTNGLLTGIIAVLAVSGVVYLRYRKLIVALPMIATALSEVVILLGLAAGIGYPIDLAVMAGFVAVIGTGVDDLIIIADEVLAQGDVNYRRVFKSRFRKAFWVIGVAAATTIVAMMPLAVLSLGDLAGFAYFTIFGVLVGVLLTRPAYGDILRSYMTSQ
jgi:preprotein translocase subunit SecD